LAACTTEQTIVAPQNEAIGFDTFVDNSTRANDVTTETIEDFGFGVYASVTNGAGQSGLILTNEEVSYDGAWGYANTQYWVAGNDYNFTAIAPYTDAKWTYAPEDGKMAQHGVISFNNREAAANQDLVFASASRKVTEAPTAKPEAVKFTFNHMLSRVRFSFANGFQSAGNIELAVSNVHITDAYANGTLAVENGAPVAAWTNLANKDLDVNFGVVAYDNSDVEFKATAAERIAEGTKLSSEYFYLIPNAEATAYEVTFDVTLFQAGVEIDTYSHTVTLKCAMNRGVSYDIKTTLTEKNTSDEEIYPIEFTVEAVNNWEKYNEVETEGFTAVASEAELKAAIAAGKSVKLAADITLAETLKITNNAIVDLNGHNISGATDVFEVAGGALTINGDGVVNAATTNGTPYCAVWAYGNAVVNIHGGTYKIGYTTGDYNDLIYAKGNAVINIYGGTFYNSGRENAFVLNVKDEDRSTADINVYGGSYEKFNPANNESEGPNTNFVAAGKTVEQNGDWYIVK
jgi:hypothetical protein